MPDYAYGVQSAAGKTCRSWTTCTDGSSGAIPIAGDADYGQAALRLADEVWAPVEDLGRLGYHIIACSKNVYEAGSGNAEQFFRFSVSSMLQHDDYPPWEVASAGAGYYCRYCRYAQTRTVGGRIV